MFSRRVVNKIPCTFVNHYTLHTPWGRMCRNLQIHWTLITTVTTPKNSDSESERGRKDWKCRNYLETSFRRHDVFWCRMETELISHTIFQIRFLTRKLMDMLYLKALRVQIHPQYIQIVALIRYLLIYIDFRRDIYNPGASQPRK